MKLIIMKNYEDLKQILNYKSVCLIGHISPDIDAIASMLVFQDFLIEHFKIPTVDLYAESTNFSPNIKYLLGKKPINLSSKEYDVAIMMDSPNTTRLGKYSNLFDKAKFKIVIDHHITNLFEGDINIVEQQSSTCEIIYKITKFFKHNISVEDQSKIYAGVITDTNNFTVGNFNKKTFNVISEIIDNIDHEYIYNKFLQTNSLKTMNILSVAINNIKSYKNSKILISHITQGEAKSLKATSEDYVGIINKLATIENNLLTCFIYPQGNEFYVSMRAKKGYKISHIAKENGGGGHDGAAAFLSKESIENIESNILESFSKLI